MPLMEELRKEFAGHKGAKYLLAAALTGGGIAGMAAEPAIPGASYVAGLGAMLLAFIFIFVAPAGYVDPSPPSSYFEVLPDEDADPVLIVTHPADEGFHAVAFSASGAAVSLSGPFTSRQAAVAALDGVPSDVPVYDVDAGVAAALEAVEPHRPGWLQDALPILQFMRTT